MEQTLHWEERKCRNNFIESEIGSGTLLEHLDGIKDILMDLNYIL